MNAVAVALLGITVALQLVGALTTLLARDAMAKLHAVSVVSVLATVPLVVALLLVPTSRTYAGQIVLTGTILAVSSPFLSRASARAIRLRRTDELVASEAELDAGRRTR